MLDGKGWCLVILGFVWWSRFTPSWPQKYLVWCWCPVSMFVLVRGASWLNSHCGVSSRLRALRGCFLFSGSTSTCKPAGWRGCPMLCRFLCEWPLFFPFNLTSFACHLFTAASSLEGPMPSIQIPLPWPLIRLISGCLVCTMITASMFGMWGTPRKWARCIQLCIIPPVCGVWR